MINWYVDIIISFLVSFGITYFVIPRILLVSFKKQLFDLPDERKVHKGLVPRLGGVSFFPSILFSLAFVVALHYWYFGNIPDDMPHLTSKLLLGVCGLVIFYLVGIMDDLLGVRYWKKFLAQVSCGILLTFSGLWINNLYGLFGIREIPNYIGMPLTVFMVVFIVNAINLIDGIDGLASGLSSIALLVLGMIFIYMREICCAMVSFATLGVLIPFFHYNVFGKAENGRKIFMGDTGSLTIGLILSFLIVQFSMHNPAKIRTVEGALIVAFSLLIIPLFDVIRVVLHRLRTGKHPFIPDKNHIHHKFLQMGFTPRKAMVTILFVSGLFGILNIALIPYVNITLLLIIDIVLWTSMHVWMNKRIMIKKIIVSPAEEANVEQLELQTEESNVN